MARQISNRHWSFVAFAFCRGGALSPPAPLGVMGISIESVGADLCVGPCAGPTQRCVRADT